MRADSRSHWPERCTVQVRGSETVTDPAKTAADQVGELTKLVEDAQEKLDQTVRALRSLQERLKQPDQDGSRN
jgi:methyl-accepting chemotaxis protein